MTDTVIARWTTPSNHLPVRYQPVPVRLQPQQGVHAMQEITKRVAVKFVGSNRPTETVVIPPGTTTRELVRTLELDPTGYHVLDARNDKMFGPEEIMFARVEDGDLVHIVAQVQLGGWTLKLPPAQPASPTRSRLPNPTSLRRCRTIRPRSITPPTMPTVSCNATRLPRKSCASSKAAPAMGISNHE